MADDGPTLSIKDRINAFNQSGTTGHLGRAPITATVASSRGSNSRPPPVQRSVSCTPPSVPSHHPPSTRIGNEPNIARRDGILPPPSNITRTGGSSQTQPDLPARPALPPRKSTQPPPPSLPPRRPSNQIQRKPSTESVASTVSDVSTLSTDVSRLSVSRTTSGGNARIKAPPYDPSKVPVLPARRSSEQRASFEEQGKVSGGVNIPNYRKLPPPQSTKSGSIGTVSEVPRDTNGTPALPPRRPSELEHAPSPQAQPVQLEPKPARPQASALSFGMNKMPKNDQIKNGVKDGLSSLTSAFSGGKAAPPAKTPPPDISKILSTKPKPASSPAQPRPCLLCRDFSVVDAHAAKFPRHEVPSLDWLAQQLTQPFPSLTDKARAIFTWLHHNIAYDVVSFSNGTIKPSTPASTLQSGLAVCEGYAGLFTALASKVGLESVVVGGHGKGFGFASLQPGSAVPPEDPSGHAWNAVKIDQGYWKLIDCCWGAGNISDDARVYNQHFSPRMFTMPNIEFGLRHFPQSRSHFFVEADGLSPPSWQEYYLGPLGGAEAVQVYSGVAESEGISESSICPRQQQIPVPPSPASEARVRFSFSTICEHWDSVRNGAGPAYVFILAIEGVDGREKDYVPFETNGSTWWCEIEARRLGCAGQTISAFTVDTVGGQSGRGLGVDGYRQAKGRKGMSFGGLCAWKLV